MRRRGGVFGRSVAAVAVVVGSVVVPTPAGASAAPAGSVVPMNAPVLDAVLPSVAGVPAAPRLVWLENFSNGMTSAGRALNWGTSYYTSSLGERYTGFPNWLDPAMCNGMILNASTPTVATGAGQLTLAGRTCGYTDMVRQLAYILGGFNGSGQLTNYVLSEYTAGNPGTGVLFERNGTTPIPAAENRFLVGSVNVGAANCGVSAPSLQWQYLDTNVVTAFTNVGAAVSGCTGGATATVPAIGTQGPLSTTYGRYYSGSSFYISQAAFQFRVQNVNGSGAGNDFAIDDVTLWDASPAIDKSFSPSTIQKNQTSTLTFTITNTSEKAAKAGWAFTDVLPAGVKVATPAKGSTTCPSTSFNPNPNQSTITISSGTLTAGMTSCTVKVDVTSAVDGVYPNGASNFSVAKGLIKPAAPATLRVSTPSPKISLTKVATPTSVTAAGQTVTYSITAKNSGSLALTSVTVSDPKVSGLGCTPSIPVATLAIGASITCSGTHVVTQAEFDSGQFLNTASASGSSTAGAVSTTASAVVKAVQSSGLAITKKVTPAVYTRSGDVLSYQINVTNTDNVTLSNVTVSDPQAVGLNCTPSIPVVSLAPGATIACTASYTVTTSDVSAGTFTNTASAAATSPTGTPLLSRRSATAVTVPDPKLEVTKTSSPRKMAEAGQIITYTVSARNVGNVPITGVTLSDPMLTDPVCAPTIPVAELEVGDLVSCQGTYEVTQDDLDAGSLPNTVTADAMFGTTPLQATDTLTITSGEEPELTVDKTVSPLTYLLAGEILSYHVDVKNTGNVTLSNVNVSDPRASGLVCSPSLPVASLKPGSSIACTATTTVSAADVAAGSVVNTASASGTSPAGTSVSGTDAVTANSVPQQPGLALSKSVLPVTFTTAGQTLTYTLIATNTGNVPLSNVAISDAKVSGLSCAPATPAASLPAGAAIVCSGTHVVTQAEVDAGAVTNTATVSGAPPTGAPLSTTAAVVAPGPVAEPHLSLSKVADQASYAAPGDRLTFTIVATNTGNVSLSSVSVSDPKLTGVSCTPAAPATLAPGAAMRCTGSYVATQADVDAQSISNHASASGAPPTGPPLAADASATVNGLPPTPRVSILKSASPTAFTSVGDTVSYTLLITNTGAATLRDITVSDSLAAPVCTPSLSGLQLAPGEHTTCSYDHTVTALEANGANVHNTASVSASSLSGVPAADAASLDTPGPIPSPSLSLVKTADVAQFGNAGSSVVFTVVVTNTGNIPISDLVVTDPEVELLCPVVQPMPTLAVGATLTCTAEHTVTQADVDAGTFANTASAAGEDLVGNPITASDAIIVPGPVAAPSLQFLKRASVSSVSAIGEAVGYTFNVTNTGNVTVASIAIADPRIANVVCAATSLAPAVSTVCTGTYVTTLSDLAAGQIVNTASVAGTPARGVLPPTTATATVAAVATPGLAVAKSVLPTAFSIAGETLNYTVTALNTGNVPLSDVAISDPSVDSLDCTWPTVEGALAPGAVVTCTATRVVTQIDVDRGTIANTASATGTSPTGTPVLDDASVTTPGPAPTPQVSLSKVATSLTYQAPGDELMFTLVATNTGTTSLSNVSIADPSIAHLSCTPSAPATLLPGDELRCSGSYTVTQVDVDTQSVSNTATATGTPPVGSAVDDTATAIVPGVPPTPRLTVVKTASPTTFTEEGQDVTWTVDVTNTGLATLADVDVTDDMGPLECDPTVTVASFAPGESIRCTIVHTVTPADMERGSLLNTATATASGPGGAPVSAVDDSLVEGPGASPRLTVVKTAQPGVFATAGEPVTFTIVATNTGNVTLSDVTVDDPTLTLDCEPSLPVLELPIGANVSCTGTAVVRQSDVDAGALHNDASASGSTPLGADVSGASSVDVLGPPAAPALVLTKTAAVGTVAAAGQVVAYTFTVVNNGNVSVSAIEITDPRVASVACPRSSLAPGEAIVCSASAVVSQSDIDSGRLVNNATVSGLPARGALPSSTASASVDAIAQPRLTTTKSVLPTVFTTAGETLVYTITTANIGNVTLSDVEVVDALLDDLSCLPAVPVASLAPGGVISCTGTHVVTQSDVDAGTLANTVSATGSPPIGDPVTSESSVVAPGPSPIAHLALSKEAAQITYVAPGDVLDYTLVATNTGNVTMSSVTITDAELAGLSCVPTAPATLAPGGSMRCTGQHTVTQSEVDGGVVDNVASVSGLPPTGGALTNTATSRVDGTPPVPQLTVRKTATPAAYAADGDVIHWSVEVTNSGLATLRDVTISDTKGAVTCESSLPIDYLAPGATVTCTLDSTVSGADVERGSVTNTAIATAESLSGEPVSANDTRVADGPVAAPRLSVTKTSSPASFSAPGEVVTFTIVTTNTGNVPLSNVTVDDPGLDVTCDPLTPLVELAVGASITCTTATTVTQADIDAGSLRNEATASGLTPLGAAVDAGAVVDVPGPLAVPGLSIVKQASTGSVSTIGDVVTYSFTVLNTGNVTISDIAVDDHLVAGVHCPRDVLAPEQTMICEATYVVAQADLDRGLMVNTAAVTGTPARGVLPAARSIATVDAVEDARLVLSKSALPVAFAREGDTVAFSLVATNLGNVTLADVTVEDPMLPSLTCVPARPVASLAPGASVLCSGTYVVTQADIDAGAITNIATASATPPIGDDIAAWTAIVVPGPVAEPRLSLSKVADRTAYTAPGERVTYTIVATNTGNVTVNNVTVSDPKLAGLTCSPSLPVARLAPHASVECSGTYTVTQADVDSGSISNSASTSGSVWGSPIGANATSIVPGVTPVGRLTVTKTSSRGGYTESGQRIIWTIEARNTGLATLTDVVVNDARGPVECDHTLPVALLAPGDSVVCTFVSSTTSIDVEKGYIANEATASASTLDGRPVDGRDSLVVDGPIASPRISVVKSSSPSTYTHAGQTVTFTVVATNTGNVALHEVVVDDPGLDLECDVTLPAAELLVGDHITCLATRVTSQDDVDAGSMHNEASAAGSTPLGVPVSGGAVLDVPGPIATPSLSITKRALQATVTTVGQVMEYEFTVTNTGNVTITEVAVVDARLDSPAVCVTTTLAPGESTTCTGNSAATVADFFTDLVVNTATASGVPARGALGGAIGVARSAVIVNELPPTGGGEGAFRIACLLLAAGLVLRRLARRSPHTTHHS